MSDPSEGSAPTSSADAGTLTYKLLADANRNKMERHLNELPPDQWEIVHFSACTTSKGEPGSYVALLRRRERA